LILTQTTDAFSFTSSQLSRSAGVPHGTAAGACFSHCPFQISPEDHAVFKIATALAMSAIAISAAASTAEAGGHGLMRGLFFGAVGAHIIGQGYRDEQRREAYEAARIRREHAIAAQRAAARREQAAEYKRLQAKKVAQAQAAAAAAASQASTTTAAAPKADLLTPATTSPSSDTVETATTNTDAAATTASTTTAAPSTTAANTATCRKYSPATAGLIDAPCPSQ
jgi:hypothetical protein